MELHVLNNSLDFYRAEIFSASYFFIEIYKTLIESQPIASRLSVTLSKIKES